MDVGSDRSSDVGSDRSGSLVRECKQVHSFPPARPVLSQVLVISHARPMARREDSQPTDAGVSEGGVPSAGQACLSLMVPSSVSSKLWSVLAAAPSVVVAGEEEWQILRVKQGKDSSLFATCVSLSLATAYVSLPVSLHLPS